MGEVREGEERGEKGDTGKEKKQQGGKGKSYWPWGEERKGGRREC